MITIDIKNAAEVIKLNKNWFISKAFSFVGAADVTVELMIINEIKKAFEQYGVKAEVTRAQKSASV